MLPFDVLTTDDERSTEKERPYSAQTPLDDLEEQVKIVIFVSGQNRYAFFGRNIREILPPCPISWVPGLPDYLPGLITVRGDVESVIDIRHFLGEEKNTSDHFLIALAQAGNFRSGIKIDTVIDVVDIPVDAITPPLSTLSGTVKDIVSGEIERDGWSISLLNLNQLAAMISV